MRRLGLTVTAIFALLAGVHGDTGSGEEEWTEMVSGSGDEGWEREEHTMLLSDSEEEIEGETFRERNLDSIFDEFNKQELNDKVVDEVTESFPDEVQSEIDTKIHVFEDRKVPDSELTEHHIEQDDLVVLSSKSTNIINDDKKEERDNSTKQTFFISRPQALKATKPTEGPTIKTDVHDFFSLFPINEVAISDLILNISSILSNDEYADNTTDETETRDTTETSTVPHAQTRADTTQHSVTLPDCECDCNLKYKYEHVDTDREKIENAEMIELVLQDHSEEMVCSPEEFRACCTEFMFQPVDVEPRIIFPDSDIGGEISFDENVLIDTHGVPETCKKYIDEATRNILKEVTAPTQAVTALPTVLDRTKFSTVDLSVGNDVHLNTTIESLGSWTLVIKLVQPMRVSLKVSSRTSLPFLAKLEQNPTLVDFDILDILEGRLMEEVSYDLDAGSWYASLKNEEHYDQDTLLSISAAPVHTTMQCRTILGREHCPGIQSVECVHGQVQDRVCECEAGWLGPSCDFSPQQCRESVCSGQGECVLGQDLLGYPALSCECEPGYQGHTCHTTVCDVQCGEHGVCAGGGKCRCYLGWEGAACNVSSVATETVCPGTMLQEEAPCPESCTVHGSCVAGQCECHPGWEGAGCEERSCDARCHLHGVCTGGRCVCAQGWGGAHCTLDECPGACSGHGLCSNTSTGGGWECQCRAGWAGRDCSTQLELLCDDRLDNDEDGLMDCEDPECCWAEACSLSQYCSTVPEPASILIRKPSLPAFASFFERYKFLVERGSLQKFAKLSEFDPRRVSVIRGRVMTPSGQGLRGVRVSNGVSLKEGFTLTRSDGWFDMLVNGGGVIIIKFGKSPFPYQSRNVYVPWNQVVVMNDVHLAFSKKRKGRKSDFDFCEEHSSAALRPVVTVEDNLVGNEDHKVREVVSLKPFLPSLVHSSERSTAYSPVLSISLVQDRPMSLLAVLARITVEGRVFSSLYEAESNLSMVFQWDGYNAYGQKHYGQAQALVSIGYQYKLCSEIIWHTQKVTLHSHIPLSSYIGGWNLDIHHRYNHRDAMVYKGDGQVIQLKEKEHFVAVMNENFTKTLIGPSAVVIDEEGVIYVGDTNYIRKIDTIGRVTNLLRLNESTTNHKYYLAITTGRNRALVMSDPTKKRILKIPLEVLPHKTVYNNFEVFVGTGETCTLRDDTYCGDGNLAKDAQLIYPKGLVVTTDDELVFVDGTRVRMIDTEGRVVALAGNRKLSSEWKPSGCGIDLPLSGANFNWPTEIALNPVNSDLTLVDQGTILHITKQGRIREIFNINCEEKSMKYSPSKVVYTPNGELIVVDDKGMIYKHKHMGQYDEVAGSMSYCKRSSNGCLQSDFEKVLTVASKAKFHHISDITVGPEGTIYVADMAKHHIRSIYPLIPKLNHREKYEIMSADSGEMFVFDKNGLHVSTRGLFASATGYDFVSNVDNELVAVNDKNMNNLKVKRVAGEVSGIELSNGMKYHIKINKKGDLEQIVAPTGHVVIYRYSDAQGLIVRKMVDRKLQFVYHYNQHGHLQARISPLSSVDDSQDILTQGGVTRYMAEENELLEELYEIESKINEVTVGYVSEIEGSPVHSIKWEYFVHSPRLRSSFSGNVDGIGKKLFLNGELSFTSELHPRSMIQSIYDSHGIQLLKVEEYGVPKRTIFFPRSPFDVVDQTYDEQRRPKKWKWGNMWEEIQYDSVGRITSIGDCDDNHEVFNYAYDDALYPNIREDKDDNEYTIQLDNSEGLEMIVTPLQHKHEFNVAADMGSYTLSYTPPWSTRAFRFKLDKDGKILQKKLSGSKDFVNYESGSDHNMVQTKQIISREIQNGSFIQQIIENPSENLKIFATISITDKSIEVKQNIIKNEETLSVVEQNCVESEQEYKVDCQINLNGEKDNFTRIFSRVNNAVKNFRDFKLVYSVQSIALINTKKQVDMKYEMDSSKKITKKEVKIRGKMVYTSAMEYDCMGRLVKLSEKLLSSTRVTEYTYTRSSRIKTVRSPKSTWSYTYDKNGNYINVDYGIGNTTFEYEAGERVSVGGYNKVTYSDLGNLVSRTGYQFVYNSLSQLTGIIHKGKMRKEIHYDLQGRPVLVEDHVAGDSVTLVYAVETKPWLVTHFYLSRTRTLHRLSYDSQDNLIAMEVREDILIVITDNMGTPSTVLNKKGEIMKEVSMSPYGTVYEDTKEDLLTCVGYHGGLDLHETGIVIIRGRPYDSVLGTWMVPGLDKIVTLPGSTDLTDIHTYRFNKNDPVNKNRRNYLNTLADWLKFFDFNLETMSSPILDPSKMRALKFGKTKSSHKQKMDVLNPKIQKPLTLEEERRSVNIARSFHMIDPIFPNIILTKESDMITAYAVEGASMVEKMMADILNRTVALDSYGDDDNTIYFVKKGGFVEEEMVSLKKYVDITEKHIAPYGTEICIQAAKTKLCGLSGIESIEHQPDDWWDNGEKRLGGE